MFNGYNETPLIQYNEFDQEREKKNEDTSKWSYGQHDGNQPTPHPHTGPRSSEFWSGKPNFLGVPKCNCSGCYPSSENQSYQNDSTRHRPWLPRSFPVPLNGSNEPCKLPGYQWNNVNLTNQGSCYQEGNIANYGVQEAGGKAPYYRHYPNLNPRLSEPNQPGVITSVKNPDLTKKPKEDVATTQEMIFHGQNGTRQAVFCNPAYNLSKRLDSRSSNYCDLNEKYSNLDSYRHSVNSYSANPHVSRLPVVEPYMKAVPSNQNRVPSTGHRSIKENMVQSYIEQDYNDPRKCSEQAMGFGDKTTMAMCQTGMAKEVNDNYQLHMGVDLKNAGIVDHRPYNMPVACGNMFKPETQMLFDNSRQADFYSRNNTSNLIKRNNPVVEPRKDCLIGQMPEQLPRMILSNAKSSCGMFYSKEFNGEKPHRQEKFDQENSSCCQRNDDLLKKENIRLPRSSLIFNDPHSPNSFAYSNNSPNNRNHLRSDCLPQGYNAQDRYEYPPVSHGGFQNQYNDRNLQQPLPSCSVGQFVSQSNNSFTYNPYFRQSEDKIVHSYFYSGKNQYALPQTTSEESRFLEMGKNNYLENIRSEEFNKPNNNKISPLRLLRKKKLINSGSENIAEATPVTSISDVAPTLDVRKFWSTWAEEEEETPTQMVVLDCQNIDPEQAKLLHLYDSDPVRAVHLESGSIITLKSSEPEQYQPTNEEIKPNLNQTSLSESDEQNEVKLKQKDDPKFIENSQINPTLEPEATVNEQSVPRHFIMEPNNQKSLNESKAYKKGRSSTSLENKESMRHKKVISDKKSEDTSPLDKWTEKKFDFLKRSEESKAAEILRHEEEKRKIFERRQSLQQGNTDGKKAKLDSKTTPRDDEKISSPIIDDNSQSGSPFSCNSSDLPTSEYRRNKFLDYSDRKIMDSSDQQEESDIDLHQKVIESITPTNPQDKEIKQEVTKQEHMVKSNWSLAPDKTDFNSSFLSASKLKEETGLENVEVDDILKKMSEIHFQNAEIKSEDDKKAKIFTGKKAKKIKKLGTGQEHDERGGNDKRSMENMSTSKPTIKFSIQKSHDLKISFKVLNSSGKEEVGREETENQIKPNDNINSTELITLKLKSIQNNDLKENKRRFRRKKLKGKLNGKNPVVKIKKRKCAMPEEEKDPLAPDSDYEKCLNLSRKNYPDDCSDDFQVQETVDSAKIKLTFKRHKSNYETECKINNVFQDADANRLENKTKKKSRKGKSHDSVAETGAESCKSEPENTETMSEVDSDLEAMSKKRLEDNFHDLQLYEEENYELKPPPLASPDHLSQAASPVYLNSNKLDTSSLETPFYADTNKSNVQDEKELTIRDDIINVNVNEEFSNECRDGLENYALIFGDDECENKNNDSLVHDEIEFKTKQSLTAIEADIEEKKENQVDNSQDVSLEFNKNVNIKPSKTDENSKNLQAPLNMEELKVENKKSETTEIKTLREKRGIVEKVDFEKFIELDISTNETNHSENIASSYTLKSDQEAKVAVEEKNIIDPTFELLSQEINTLDVSKENESKEENQILEDLVNSNPEISVKETGSNPNLKSLDENVENKELLTNNNISELFEICEPKEESSNQTENYAKIPNDEYEYSKSETEILENDMENNNCEHTEILSDILDPKISECELLCSDIPDPMVVQNVPLSETVLVDENLKNTQEKISDSEKTKSPEKEENLNEIVGINKKLLTVEPFGEYPETELEEGEIVDDSSNDEGSCFHNTGIIEKSLIPSDTNEKIYQKEMFAETTSKKSRFLQEVNNGCHKIIQRRHSLVPKSFESLDQNSFFTFSNSKSCFTKAKSCPPRLTFFEEVRVPVLDIPVEDIPLPPGDPLPENCFDLKKYFLIKKSTEDSSEIKITSKLDSVRLVKTTDSPINNISPSNSLNGNKSLSPATKDLRKENENNSEFPLNKSYKIKFSLVKRRSPLSVFRTGEVQCENKLALLAKKTEKPNESEKKKQSLKDFEKVETVISSNERKSSNPDEKLNEVNSSVPEENAPNNCENFSETKDPNVSPAKVIDESTTEEIRNITEFENVEEITKLSENSETNLQTDLQVITMPEEKLENVADQLEAYEVIDETISVLNFDNNRTLRSEFYECEGISISEDLPNEDDDIEVEKVSDDDKFRNIMQNCLDNAKKFLNVGNLKLFSCSVDDLLELHCPDSTLEESEPVPDSTNHISKDVLLTSCEDTAQDELGLSEKFQPSDMSMDFVPSFGSEGPHNLCPEILPVDNWPYLEEEVPSSPIKMKPEETDLIPSLENLEKDFSNSDKGLSPEEIGKINRSRKLVFPGKTALKQFRRRSLMGDTNAFEKLSKFNPQRRKTIDAFSGNVLSYKKSGRLLHEIKKLKNGLENLWENNNSLKCRLSLKKLANGKKFVSSHEEEDTESDSCSVFEPAEFKSERSTFDFKSPTWQPKVMLFRISKGELRGVYKNSRIKSYSEKKDVVKELKSPKVERSEPDLKKQKSCDLIYVKTENMDVLKDQSEKHEFLTEQDVFPKDESDVDSFKGSISAPEVRKRKKSRFRNLHTKRKSESEIVRIAKDIEFAQNSMPIVSTTVDAENDLSELFTVCNVPKERVMSSNAKSTNENEEERKSGDDRKRKKSRSLDCETNSSSFLSDKNRLVNEGEKSQSHAKTDKHVRHQRSKHEHRKSESKSHRERQKERKESSRHRDERKDKPSTLEKKKKHESLTLQKVAALSEEEGSSDNSWVCEVCGFSDASERTSHIKSHPFHCQSCHLAFKTEAFFVNHLTKKHKDIRNQHHCLLCELSFDTDEQYQKHLDTREHRHLESVEKNTINTLFTLLTGQPCPVLGVVEMKPEWLPNQAGTVHFYHQATPLSLALQYLKMRQDLTSYSTVSSAHPN